MATNRPEPIYIITNRSTVGLPKRFDPVTQQANPNFEEELSTLKEQHATGSGVVVYFQMTEQEAISDEAILVENLSLKIRTRAADGIIYDYDN